MAAAAAAFLRPLSPRCSVFGLFSPHLGMVRSPSPVRPSRGRRVLPLNYRLSTNAPSEAKPPESQISGMEEALMALVTGKMKATEVAHLVWKNIIHKGDTVVDATCGNGFDTLALLKMVAEDSGDGCVYGMDIQDAALDSTSSLLDRSVDENERKLVKLFKLCHSKMQDIIPKEIPVRLVAFNLGYLPGGDKKVITTPGTTLSALEAASRILRSGGLISVLVYVGHPGGREELQTVQSFASSLPVETWVSSKYEMLNRTGPVLVLIFKRQSSIRPS